MTPPRTRVELTDDMMRGIHPPPSGSTRASMDAALSSFSDRQLEEMHAAGVRFWPADAGMPPEISETGVANPRAREAYIPEARTIRYTEGMSASRLRHELAHAYDDVHGERAPHRLDDLPLAERTREMGRLDREVSRHRAFGSERDHAIGDSFEAYRAERPHVRAEYERYDFDVGARTGYSATDVHEFYAEGFSAFHGDAEHARRLEHNAPGLYRHLLEESRAEGTTPSWIRSDGTVAPD